MRQFIDRFIDNIANFKWDIIFYLKFIFNFKFRRILNANKQFKNLYKSKRCFIVGNGPSLNQQDLSKISNEIVFTVNEIMSNEKIYKTLNSDFHVIIDPYYFNFNIESSDDKGIIDLLKQINYENKKPICITSYEGVNAFNKYGLDKILNLKYIFQHRYLTNACSRKIRMDKNMPTTLNVIQAAILAAIYMGFKQIYLIGCDMSFVFLPLEVNQNTAKKEIKSYHAYDYSNKQKMNIIKFCGERDNEYIMYEYAKTFTIYKNIRKYAEKNNIEIINATLGGALDVFERINYNSLFQKQ